MIGAALEPPPAVARWDGPAWSPLDTVAAARDRARAAEEALRAAVDAAREDGHTWQEIGDVLGTSRQAAFQRFGRPVDPRTGAVMADSILPGAADRAVGLLADLVGGRWEEACRDFDETVAARLDATRLAGVWAQVTGMVGRFVGMGEPLVRQAGDYTVVDVPLSFEAGERTGRLSYDRHGRVAGLHLLGAEAAGR